MSSLFDEPQELPEAELKRLLRYAEEMVNLERQIDDLNALLKKLNGRATELKTIIIPDKMAEVGLLEFKTPNGDRLKVEDFVAGTLPKEPERRARAIVALEEMGGASLVKNQLTLEFEKSEHNEAMSLAEDLRERGFAVDVNSSVHHMQLSAFVKEKLRSGEHVDFEPLGVFVGKKTKVELKK